MGAGISGIATASVAWMTLLVMHPPARYYAGWSGSTAVRAKYIRRCLIFYWPEFAGEIRIHSTYEQPLVFCRRTMPTWSLSSYCYRFSSATRRHETRRFHSWTKNASQFRLLTDIAYGCSGLFIIIAVGACLVMPTGIQMGGARRWSRGNYPDWWPADGGMGILFDGH